MFGLMTLWFGPFVDLPPDHGYFHLCPECYQEFVHPHVERVQGRLAELHPLTHILHRHTEAEAEQGDVEVTGSGDGAKGDPAPIVEGAPRPAVAAGGGAAPSPRERPSRPTHPQRPLSRNPDPAG
jgi:hypothetical protein